MNTVKPNLLIAVGEFLEGAGQSRVVHEEVLHLCERFNITVVADSIVWSSDIDATLEDLSSSTNVVHSVKRLRELIKGADVVHCHDSLKMMSVTAFSAKPWIVTSHGIAPFWLRRNVKEMAKGVITNLCYPLLYRKATKLVAISPYIEGWLRRYTRRDVVLIANGAPASPDSIGRRAPAKPTLLYVGEISRRKGIRDLAKAARLLHKGVTIEIVGVGDITKFLHPDEVLMATVNVRGFVSDAELESLYKNATCVISASHWEGYGLPLMEGFARGTPALARKSTNLTCLVHDSGAGRLFGSVREIPNCLDEIIGDWEKLSVNAQNFARAHSWEDAFKQYEDLLQGLI